jgi:hypothetical protein
MERLLSNQMRSAARESKQGLLYSMPTCSADRKERERNRTRKQATNREKKKSDTNYCMPHSRTEPTGRDQQEVLHARLTLTGGHRSPNRNARTEQGHRRGLHRTVAPTWCLRTTNRKSAGQRGSKQTGRALLNRASSALERRLW